MKNVITINKNSPTYGLAWCSYKNRVTIQIMRPIHATLFFFSTSVKIDADRINYGNYA